MDAVTFGVIQRLRFFYGERLSEGRRVLRRRRSPGGIWILIGIGFLSKKTHTRRTVLESSGVTVSRFSVRAGSLHPRKSCFLRKVPVRVRHFLPSGLWVILIRTFQTHIRDLVNKPARSFRLYLPFYHTALCRSQSQALLRPRDPHIAETALLLQCLRSFHQRHHTREKTIFHSCKIHIRELQTLCGMKRHEDDPVLGFVHTVNVRNQSNLL